MFRTVTVLASFTRHLKDVLTFNRSLSVWYILRYKTVKLVVFTKHFGLNTTKQDVYDTVVSTETILVLCIVAIDCTSPILYCTGTSQHCYHLRFLRISSHIHVAMQLISYNIVDVPLQKMKLNVSAENSAWISKRRWFHLLRLQTTLIHYDAGVNSSVAQFLWTVECTPFSCLLSERFENWKTRHGSGYKLEISMTTVVSTLFIVFQWDVDLRTFMHRNYSISLLNQLRKTWIYCLSINIGTVEIHTWQKSLPPWWAITVSCQPRL